MGALVSSSSNAKEAKASPAPSSASTAKRQAAAKGSPRAARDLLGVGIGDRESDFLPKLDAIGKRTTTMRRDGGRRHTIELHETPFTYLIVITNARGEVRRLSGFVRPGQEIPFDVLGDTAAPSGSANASMFWDLLQEEPARNYRLVAKGNERRAQVIFLIGAPKRGNESNDTVDAPTPTPTPTQRPKK